ncbi:hypothetical protein M0L20_25620 [Spirosoma sp. RP8]|uniref:CBM3 domain-containing protein n=1 Tax=Spirosoma liriopis TaxID=2937440 RepID=A0ABT0HSW0_9BACT|nr:cellulose binding domain-containing protein [Spirosoma liriopis]MCK8495274.1 hypothetical protein [Spirosoma liriopis]
MRKISTSYLFANLCLLISGMALTFSAYAQTNYSEGNDFPGIAGATTYTLNQAGDYTFSGTIQTPNDQQDAFKVIIPVGFKITKAVLQASGGNSQQQPSGFVSFADSYPGYSSASFSNSSGVNVTRTGDLGPNSESNPYVGLASVDYSVGTSWSIRVTVVSTVVESTCFAPTVPTISATRTSICAGSNTILTIQSGSLNDATNWIWYSGSCGGTPVGTGSAIQVSPGSTTTYYARGEGGCVTPGACASQQITVNAPFFPSLSNNGPLTCAKTSVILTTTGGPSGASYTYSPGAQASSPSSLTAAVSQSGPYSVTVSVTGGCSAIATTTVTSNTVAPPVVVTPTSQTICSGRDAYFSASGADAYRWSNGANTATIGVNVAGTYTVTGTRTSNGCTATATGQLTVLPTPTLSLDNARTASSSRCDTPNGQIGFTTSVAGGEYSFNYRISGLSGVQTKTVTVADSRFVLAGLSGGSYYGFSLSSGGCTGTNSVTVTLTSPVPPSVSINPASQTICQGQTANFTAQGADAYLWSTGATTASISAGVSGAYSVTGTASNGCSATATATLTVNEKPLAPSANNVSVCQNSTPVSLVGSVTQGSNLRWYTRSTGGTGSSTAPTPPTSTVGSTTYYVSQLNSSGCESDRTPVTYTVTPLPNPSIVGLADSYCQGTTAVTLLGSPSGGVFTVDGSTATVFNPASLLVGQHTVVYSYTNSSGCSATASQLVSVKEVPQPPTITTQSGGSYPAGVSNLTISQNTGNVILTVSGCQGGSINWSGGNASTLAVSTANLGTQSFTATCTSNGCTSPTATATVTVVAPTLKVLSRDPDNGQLNNNTIKPYLLLQNAGTTPIAYSTITLRYWLTTENTIPLNFQKNYIQIGQNNLNLRYVPLDPARQGATGYIEYSFSGGAGSLAPNGDSGPLEIQVTKQDYSQFVQSDDYSYINNSSFTLNPRITAYQNGTIFYGTEPSGTGSTREAVPEAGSLLEVKVLGNPVVGQSAEVEISGVSGQTVQLKLVDLQGKTLHGQSIKEAGSVERVSLPLANAQGIFLLDVSTATQRQQIKLLRP